MSLENIEIHFRSRVSRSVNEKLAAAALVEKCCVAWRFDSWLMCQWSIENKSIFQDEKLLCFLFSYAAATVEVNFHQLHTITPTLDLTFNSDLIICHDIICQTSFSLLSGLNQETHHTVCFKKTTWKVVRQKSGKNMRLKLMFSAVTIIDCFWKSFHFRTLNNKLKKCCMQTALRVSSFPFSLCCGNNFEGGTFESPFSSAILLQRLWKRLEMEL